MGFGRIPQKSRPVIAAAPLFASVLAFGATGSHTGHQFAVTESGAATVTVPIQVPRGIAGMEPQLALNYSSGAGNGLLGIGWTLSGPSSITRCPKSLALDGARAAVRFGQGDRYCLDGQRLVISGPPINTDSWYGQVGTSYKTERDSFSRITTVGPAYSGQSNTPSGFKVETKAGLILEFGLSSNSQVTTNFVAGVSTPLTINRWMLQRISDRNGNFVEFIYCGGEVSGDGTTCTATEGSSAWSGSKVLHYVRYTNRGTVNGDFAVVFSYEGRPDRVQGFHAGSTYRQTQRLSKIEAYREFTGPSTAARGRLVRGYDITYEQLATSGGASLRATNTSRLQKIQERAVRESDGATLTLPALEFTLAADAVFEQTAKHTESQTAGPAPTPIETCGGITANRKRLLCP